MKRRTAIDVQRLWEMAEQGKPAREIMQELDITDMATLKNALQGLMQEKGKTINVPGLIGKSSVNAEYTDTGARIPPAMKDPENCPEE